MYVIGPSPAPEHPIVATAILHLREVWADHEPITVSVCYPTDATAVIHLYADGRRVDARSVSLVTV